MVSLIFSVIGHFDLKITMVSAIFARVFVAHIIVAASLVAGIVVLRHLDLAFKNLNFGLKIQIFKNFKFVLISKV